ncbi:MAG: hypothetical protein IPH07_30525 [Deltaproteobacteria bacterium]|nr:hypothetical protein [Deltaproteobacteria bacterium]MBK8234510.1 hypothetical protein [Deltaproteobacteria bacterium]MBK8715253.1 hypothetical protein [Deltaproteobacteria bacterium]MBP7285043.1 hypothetical protein [Nannocystaceae bacterium]
MTRLLSTLLSLALAAPAAGPIEVPPEITDAAARDHFAAGMAAWLRDDYPTAQAELERAYAQQSVPILLYALGQLSRLQGDCERARERFTAYLQTGPSESAAQDTRVNLERCVSATPEPPPPAVPSPRVEVTPASATVLDRAPPRGRGAAIGVLAAGAVVAPIGAVLLATAFARQRAAERESGVDAFERGVRGARAQYWGGVGLLCTGAVAIVGAGVWLAVLQRRRPVSRSSTPTHARR